MTQISKAPQSDYTGNIVVDPLTRIEGHLRVEVEVENGKVAVARSCGTLFRGLELILRGRDPRDAQHVTQRTCGVCTYVHALASTRALEDAINKPIPANATHIRNLMLGMQFMHDHLTHFYALHALDFVDVTGALQASPEKAASIANSISNRKATADEYRQVQTRVKAFVESGQLGIFNNAFFLGGHPAYKLEPELNLIATADYLKALRVQVEAARAMAIFGGKNPHPQFLVAGGVTCYDALKPEKIEEFKKIYRSVRSFIEEYYIPDLLAVAKAYPECATYGGTTGFYAGGEFPVAGGERKLESRWFKPGIIYDRQITNVRRFDPSKVEEHVRHSWYTGEAARHPYEGESNPQFTFMGDTDRYSWLKAPRYEGKSLETGPLAQVLAAYGSGHKEVKALVDSVLSKLNAGPEVLFSMLGRTAARGIETLAITHQMEKWLELYENNIAKDKQIVEDYDVPANARGVGFVNAPRGGLSHWLVTDEQKRIKNFQLVVPTTWNCGPRDAKGIMGPAEEALVGTPIADPKRPVEILRVIHSFDPCIACAVHVIDGKTNERREFQVV